MQIACEPATLALTILLRKSPLVVACRRSCAPQRAAVDLAHCVARTHRKPCPCSPRTCTKKHRDRGCIAEKRQAATCHSRQLATCVTAPCRHQYPSYKN